MQFASSICKFLAALIIVSALIWVFFNEPHVLKPGAGLTPENERAILDRLIQSVGENRAAIAEIQILASLRSIWIFVYIPVGLTFFAVVLDVLVAGSTYYLEGQKRRRENKEEAVLPIHSISSSALNSPSEGQEGLGIITNSESVGTTIPKIRG